MDPIDLRSDTVTKPSEGMIEAMFSAKVGDDVYHEDPSVNALQDYVAEFFGAEQALYFPTGSMANQAAIKLHTQPGEQLIAHEWSHVYNYEGGGVSFNSGVSCKLLSGARGLLTADQIAPAKNPSRFLPQSFNDIGMCREYHKQRRWRMLCAGGSQNYWRRM